eukprot:GFUD01017089.1.p1 GENE.GFUD01017089.1~~GFUD01017089.1.p1  ORF type:complete len:788 (+),score=264.91 GFUD01017089.1:241-2364(+)
MDNDADNHTANDATTATSASMVAHQAAVATSEACLTSMAAHQFYQAQYLEAVPAETVPQLDGMDDLDTEDDSYENSPSAEALPDTDASELANPSEVTSNIKGGEVAGIENNPSSREDGEFLHTEFLEQNDANNEEVDAAEETSAAYDVDNDNEGLKGGEEISPDFEFSEIHDGIKAGEEFKKGTFDGGSNLQNAEEIGDVDLAYSVDAQEIYLLAQDANRPTEEAMDTYDDSDMLAHGAAILDDSVDADNTGTEGSEEGADVLDGSAEIIDDGDEEVEDEKILDDGADVLYDSAEVYEGDDVFDNNKEYYGEGEDEEMYNKDSSSHGFSQPPVKRARMSSDAEVILDSEDEEVTNVGVAAKPMPQQAQVRSSQQQNMMAHQQPMQSSGHSLSQQPHTASLSHQLTGRKRKLESAAICIKDGQVYFKPFTQLPKVLLNRKSTKHYPDRNTHKPSPLHPNTSKPTLQPYKHSVEIHQMVGQQGRQEPQQASKHGQQRIRQLPPGIVVQRTAVMEESMDSVEDDDEYLSDDPEEVIDGQEVEEDCDIIGEHTNNDVYSEEEEDVESCDVVQENSEQGETHEDVDVQDESEEGETNEDADVQEDSEEETHDNDSKENDSEHQEDPLESEIQEDYITHSTAEVDVEFEEASVDVQEAEACEENDKFDMVLEVKPSEETSEKQGDLIEAEQVANCNESQKDNDDLPAAALVAE